MSWYLHNRYVTNLQDEAVFLYEETSIWGSQSHLWIGVITSTLHRGWVWGRQEVRQKYVKDLI